MVKYIFVTGGVLSSVGKGILTSSIGKMLQTRGLKVNVIKIDPYVNVDAGTMNPYMHGEVYVTDDGGETDLDLGWYERFLDLSALKFTILYVQEISMQVDVMNGHSYNQYMTSAFYFMALGHFCSTSLLAHVGQPPLLATTSQSLASLTHWPWLLTHTQTNQTKLS